MDLSLCFVRNYAYNKGQNKRQPWFETSCCPTNISRFVPQIPGLIYGLKDGAAYINLFVWNTTSLYVHGEDKVNMMLTSDYPGEGTVSIRVEPERASKFKLYVRIVKSNELLILNQDKIAIERSPVVYCAKEADNENLRFVFVMQG